MSFSTNANAKSTATTQSTVVLPTQPVVVNVMMPLAMQQAALLQAMTMQAAMGLSSAAPPTSAPTVTSDETPPATSQSSSSSLSSSSSSSSTSSSSTSSADAAAIALQSTLLQQAAAMQQQMASSMASLMPFMVPMPVMINPFATNIPSASAPSVNEVGTTSDETPLPCFDDYSMRRGSAVSICTNSESNHATCEGISHDGSSNDEREFAASSSTLSASNSFRGAHTSLSTVLRASGSTPLAGLAGALAKRIRGGQTVELESMGPSSVSQAMRALALARSFLHQEGIAVVMKPAFMFAPPRSVSVQEPQPASSHSPHPGLKFTVRGEPARQEPEYAEVLRVTKDSVVGKAAGAIAKLTRGLGVYGDAVGVHLGPCPKALNVAAKAMTLARAMLHEDCLDIELRPKLPMDNGVEQLNMQNPENMTMQFTIVTLKVVLDSNGQTVSSTPVKLSAE